MTYDLAQPKLGSGERFKRLSSKLAARGVRDPDALAAHIGRRKYGAKKMGALSHHSHSGDGLGGILLAGREAYSADPDETVKCPSCGKMNSPDAKYCDQCGAKLPEDAFADLAGQAMNAIELARGGGAGTEGQLRSMLGLDRQGAANSRRPMSQKITSPWDVLITRSPEGRAVIRHRRGGDLIGEISHTPQGWVATPAGGQDRPPTTHQRSALMNLLGGWNSSVAGRAAGDPIQPAAAQTPLMAQYGIPAIRTYSNDRQHSIALATAVAGSSDGPRSGGDLAGLSPRGVTIYKKLTGKGFPHARAAKFARRAQNFGRGGSK